MPYSMPLWTILEKCPAPTLPAWTKPNSPSGLSVSKTGCALATSSACRRTSAHSRSQAPDAAGDAAVDEADALLGEESRRAPGRRSIGSFRRRRPCRPRPAAPRARRSSPGRIAGRHHHPDDLRRRELLDHLLAGCSDVADVGVAVEADDCVTGLRSRARMLPPILPRPMSPMCMRESFRAASSVTGVGESWSSALHPQRHQQVPEVEVGLAVAVSAREGRRAARLGHRRCAHGCRGSRSGRRAGTTG